MSVLDELERLSKEATTVKWEYDDGVVYAQNEPPCQYEIPRLFIGKHIVEVQNLRDSDNELIVLMRNNIDALIAVARAAQSIVKAHYIDATCKDCTGETNHVEQLLESLERLEKVK